MASAPSGSAAKRAQGLGSAKHGVGHFIAERVTSIVLAPLSLWVVYAVIALAPLPYEGVVAWLRQPMNLILSTVFIAMAFYHMGLGLQVVIEDYIHKRGTLVLCLLLNNLVWWLSGTVAIVSIFIVAFSGAHA